MVPMGPTRSPGLPWPVNGPSKQALLSLAKGPLGGQVAQTDYAKEDQSSHVISAHFVPTQRVVAVPKMKIWAKATGPFVQPLLSLAT